MYRRSTFCFSTEMIPSRFLQASLALLTILLVQPAQSATKSIYSPESISDISGRVFADSDVPRNLTNMSVFGETAAAVSQSITSWNLGTYTGVTSPAPLGNHQRGIDNGAAGSCAVQMAGTQVGAVIDTASIPDGGYNNYLTNAQVKYNWNDLTDNIRPWEYSTSALNMSFNMKIPMATAAPGTCGYVLPSLLVVDEQDNGLWLQEQVLDTRGGMHDFFGWDPGTDKGYANGYFGNQSQYCSKLPGSSSSTRYAWSDWRYYGFSISREQLLQAVTDINDAYGAGLSTAPEDYRLALMTIQAEVSWPAGDVLLAMGIDNITMWESGVPEPGTLALLATGLIGLLAFAFARRKRR